MRWIWGVAVLIGCGHRDDPEANGDSDDGVPAELCDPVAPACVGQCPPGPDAVEHGPWSNWLTATPVLSWQAVPGAASYEIAVGAAPGNDDIACWTNVGDATSATLKALWGVQHGGVYYPSLRAIDAAGDASAAITSDGWQVDIQPPDVPGDVDDDAASVSGDLSWTHPGTDDLSGFDGYEVAVGTAPGLDDAIGWAPVGVGLQTTLTETLTPEAWYWLAVRGVDVAGNHSQPGISPGFIACPDGFAFVPGRLELGSSPFCIARYEMRIEGDDNGDQPFDAADLAESRGTGIPWVNLDKAQARIACDALGFSYQLITNLQWQAIARSIENEPSNWSGGVVGSGLVPRGHSDESPFQLLEGETDPCEGTGNPECEDVGHNDWGQRRTHQLQNGEILWDFAGNAWEQVDGSTGAPDGLWMSYSDAPFTSDPGWEDYRQGFGPEGPYDGSHGMCGI